MVWRVSRYTWAFLPWEAPVKQVLVGCLSTWHHRIVPLAYLVDPSLHLLLNKAISFIIILSILDPLSYVQIYGPEVPLICIFLSSPIENEFIASITRSTITCSNVCSCITLTVGPMGCQIVGSLGPKSATVGI